MSSQIPEPITFNPVKHHFRFLSQQIKKWRSQMWHEAEQELLTIGNNLLDFYIGPLSVNSICTETLLFFEDNRLLEREIFLKWINKQKYNKIQLSDHSFWIIKKGDSNKRYVHIHPGKNSVHTMRVRATTLKTVIALNIQLPDKKVPPTVNEINQIRIDFLKLSPVKQVQEGKGILKLWQLFSM